MTEASSDAVDTADSDITMDPKPSGDPCWHLFIVKDGEYPKIISGELGQIITAIAEVKAAKDHEDVFLACFYGLQASFTPDPLSFLVWPGGEFRTPLFDTANEDAPGEPFLSLSAFNKLKLEDGPTEINVPGIKPAEVKNDAWSKPSSTVGHAQDAADEEETVEDEEDDDLFEDEEISFDDIDESEDDEE